VNAHCFREPFQITIELGAWVMTPTPTTIRRRPEMIDQSPTIIIRQQLDSIEKGMRKDRIDGSITRNTEP
jgi:hypothetical protein